MLLCLVFVVVSSATMSSSSSQMASKLFILNTFPSIFFRYLLWGIIAPDPEKNWGQLEFFQIWLWGYANCLNRWHFFPALIVNIRYIPTPPTLLPATHPQTVPKPCISNPLTPTFRLSRMSTHTIFSSIDRVKSTGLISLFILSRNWRRDDFLSASETWPLDLELGPEWVGYTSTGGR